MKTNILMQQKDIEKAIGSLASAIIKEKKDLKKVVFIGILTRGVHIAERIIRLISRSKKINVPLGYLDITFYRDDVDSIAKQPVAKETKIPFDLTEKEVILVDDVLFTGRSIRAALDEIMDFGRPKRIQLAVLIDRGHREIPISADYTGKTFETEYTGRIQVKLKEIDKIDQVVILK